MHYCKILEEFDLMDIVDKMLAGLFLTPEQHAEVKRMDEIPKVMYT